MSGLGKWLDNDNIQYVESVLDWQEAIHTAARPLLKNKVISEDYVQSIIKQKSELGPYFVIAPRIAMPHARPEEGAIALGLSIVKLGQAVNFDADEHDPVDAIFMFSAPDSNSHIEMITQLAEVLSDDEIMERIFNATTVDELKSVLLHNRNNS